MALGERIKACRQNAGMSQEKVAEQMYSLYKPEEEKKIAEKRRRRKKRLRIGLPAALILVCIIGSLICIHMLPVRFDAGACSGGYGTFLFDKYSEELVEKFYNGMADNSGVSSVSAIRGTQEASWDGRSLYLQFDIQYEHSEAGTVTEQVGFIGRRTWFDTYKWSGAIIVG